MRWTEEEIEAALQQVADLNDIVSSLAGVVPEAELAEVRELIDHSEAGIGFELLCDRIFESGSSIPRSTLMRLKSVGRYLEVGEKHWRNLRIQ